MKKLRHKCKVTLSLFVTMLLVIGSVTASLATDENSSAKAYSATLTDDQITLTLNAVVNGDLPDDTKLTVKKVTSNESEYKGLEKKLSNQATEDHYINNGSSIYDYAFVSENKEVTPTGDVTLTMTYSQAYAPSGATNEDEVSLFKLSSPVVNLAKDTKTKITTANQSNKVTQISYTTNSLDPIALVYREKKQSVSKVNVHYVNAKDTSKELADVKTISGSELSGEMSLDNLSKALVNTDNYTYTYQKAALDKANGTTIQGLKADKKDDVTKLYYITSGSKDYTTYKGEGESYEVNIYLLYDVTEKVKEDTSKKEETSKTEATTSETKVAEEASKSESTTSKTKATEETQKSTASENNKKTDEQKVEMPAASFNASTSKLKISVTASENAFPKGTTMKAKEISASTAKSIAKEKMKDVKDAIGADITFYYQGKEIEPANNKNVTVKMEPKNTLDEKHFNVLHKKDSGEVEKIDAEVKDKKFVFKTKSFSIYVIADANVDTYEFYDGDTKISEQIIVSKTDSDGKTVVEELVQPKVSEKKDYKFIGWVYENGESFTGFGKNTPSIQGKTYKIYAKYQKVYYVFFMSGTENGDEKKVAVTKEGVTGDAIDSNTISQVNQKLGLSSDQAVVGWYYDTALTKPVNNEIKINNTNITVYPKIASGHYITFDSKGGSYCDPKFVAANEPVSNLPEPTKAGYKFKYWSTTDPDNDENASEYVTGNKLDEGLKLYAVYDADTVNYKVVFWKQSVTDSKDATKKHYDVADTDTRIAKSGSTISPTYADINNKYTTGFSYNSYKVYNHDGSKTVDGSGNTVLNVYYDRKVIKINFVYNEIIGYGKSRDWWGNEYTDYSKPIYRTESHEGLYESAIDFQWPTEKKWQYKKNGQTFGLTFLDRYLLPDPTDTEINLNETTSQSNNNSLVFRKETLSNGEYTIDQNLTNEQSQNFYITDKYYGFTAYSYQLNNEKEVILNKNKNSDGAYDKDENGQYIGGQVYYTTDGYRQYKVTSKGYIHLDKNDQLTINYKRNSYKLHFINAGSEETYTEKFEASLNKYSDEMYNPQKPASLVGPYKFAGWYKDQALTTPFDFGTEENPTKMPANDVNLYAKWVVSPVSVTVKDNDAQGSELQKIDKIDYGNTVNVKQLPTVVDSDNNTIQEGSDVTYNVPKGYTWIGWATKENGIYTLFNFDTHLTKDYTLYPYIITNSKYTITYNAGNGRGSVIDEKSYAAGSYADVKSGSSLTAPAGSLFLNWQVETPDPDKEGDWIATDTYLYPNDKYLMTSDVKLVAHYIPNPQLVYLNYYSNLSDEDTSYVAYNKDDVINNSLVTLADSTILGNLVPTDSNTNLVFDGWNTKRDGSGQTYSAGNKVRIDKDPENGGPVNCLYAQWKYKVNLTVKKDVTGNQGDHTKYFKFHVVVTNVKSNKNYTLTGGSYKDNPTTVTSNSGVIDTYVYLKNDESIIINNLLLDKKGTSTYKVEEVVNEDGSDAGYKETYTIDLNSENIANNVSGSSTGSRTFAKNSTSNVVQAKEVAVTFINDKNGSIPTGIEKNVVITLPLIIAGIGFVLLMLKKKNEVE